MAAFDADNNLQVDTAEFIDGIAGRVDKVCFTHETRFRRSTLRHDRGITYACFFLLVAKDNKTDDE